jgi:hypothetical protein
MNVLGTKLMCETCGAQAVVIKAGDGQVSCHGKPMKVVAGAMDEASRERRQRGGEADPDSKL